MYVAVSDEEEESGLQPDHVQDLVVSDHFESSGLF